MVIISEGSVNMINWKIDIGDLKINNTILFLKLKSMYFVCLLFILYTNFRNILHLDS